MKTGEVLPDDDAYGAHATGKFSDYHEVASMLVVAILNHQFNRRQAVSTWEYWCEKYLVPQAG